MSDFVVMEGLTREGSTVAPPAAKLYASVKLVLYVLTRSPSQFTPPAVVYPGNAGLPKGLEAEGFVLETSKPVCV